MTLESIDPATGERIASYDEHDEAEVRRRLAAAAAAQRQWRRYTFADRAKPLVRAAELLEERAGEYAVLMAREMGKPRADGEGEAKKCAAGCRFYAEHGGGRSSPTRRWRRRRGRASSPTSRWACCSP